MPEFFPASLLYKAFAERHTILPLAVNRKAEEEMSARFPDASTTRAPQLPAQDACRLLPALTSELATAQTTQNEEVEYKQNQLLRLQDELRKGNERLERVSACVCATNRAITVARDNAAQAGLRCRALEESLVKLVREREEMRTHLEAVGRERERGEIQTEEYVRKMAVHTESVSQAEEGGTAHQELARLQTKKQELEQKRVAYLSGGGEGLEILSGQRRRQLLEGIAAAETGSGLLDKAVTEIKERKREREKQIQRWRREVDVGRRRRQAQLTRLHRQLQEAQARRRQWARQVSSLHTTLSLLREKLQDQS